MLRGVWVLENIFDTPPSPPRASVSAIEPDIRGATTIREQLAKHRNDISCTRSHAKIDPPGFALENFDVIGYGHGPEVDASGGAPPPERTKFRDIED